VIDKDLRRKQMTEGTWIASALLVKLIKKRIKLNKNAVIVITGGTGSGKTYAGLTLGIELAKILGTTFSVDGNVGFKFQDLLAKMEKDENMKPGCVFFFDESGTIGSGSNSRQALTKANIMFLSFMQTCRHRNQVLILTLPSFNYMDSGIRQLVHILLEMSSIDFAARTSFAKTYILQTNMRTGKVYNKNLRYQHDGRMTRLPISVYRLPPKKFCEEYEVQKLKFTRDLNQTILDFHNKGKEKVEGAINGHGPEKVNKIDVEKLRDLVAKETSMGELMQAFQCSDVSIRRAMKLNGIVWTRNVQQMNGERMRIKAPEKFMSWVESGMTNIELGLRSGVSTTTIKRWKSELEYFGHIRGSNHGIQKTATM
jgi:hypothetical protein